MKEICVVSRPADRREAVRLIGAGNAFCAALTVQRRVLASQS